MIFFHARLPPQYILCHFFLSTCRPSLELVTTYLHRMSIIEQLLRFKNICYISANRLVIETANTKKRQSKDSLIIHYSLLRGRSYDQNANSKRLGQRVNSWHFKPEKALERLDTLRQNKLVFPCRNLTNASFHNQLFHREHQWSIKRLKRISSKSPFSNVAHITSIALPFESSW